MRSRARLAVLLAVGAVIVQSLAACAVSGPSRGHDATSAKRPTSNAAARTLHYAANDYGRNARARLRRLGYRLADVSDASLLRSLPRDTRGMAYVGMCGGNTKAFRATVNPYRHSKKLYGFYLVDEPAPRECSTAHLRAESRYIHRHFAHARTFVLLQSLASSRHPRFYRGYNRAHTGVDLFGLDPYPCRSEVHGCVYFIINRYVRAAKRAGFAQSRLVPVFQAFGGGRWTDDGGGHWVLPTAPQARRLICRWGSLVPHPAFDYTYSWGTQNGDKALSTAPAGLRAVFAAHNRGRLKC
ncbi:MAG TPA: hypothetical protein VFH38_00140 [Jatrophihabitans sp.]|nr:hypothetical protein [Jatrophihabitans sp.]